MPTDNSYIYSAYRNCLGKPIRISTLNGERITGTLMGKDHNFYLIKESETLHRWISITAISSIILNQELVSVKYALNSELGQFNEREKWRSLQLRGLT